MTPALRKGEIPADQYDEYLEKHYTRNMVANILDVGFFQFAMSVISVTVVLPAFCARLGASNVVISFIQAITLIGWFLPQLFVSFFVESMFRKKPYVLFIGIFQRLPWLGLGFLTLYLLPDRAGLMLIMLFACFIMASLAGGLNSTAWGDMIAKAIPQRLRGFFMGTVNVTGHGLAIIGGMIVKFVMEGERYPYPQNYAVLFFCAFVILVISYVAFALNQEPILPLKRERPPNLLRYFSGLPGLLKEDRNFSLFILSRILGTSNIMAMAFYMVHAMARFNLDERISGNFILASTVATMIASLAFGRIADRFGHKYNLVLSRVLHTLAPLLAILAWNHYVMYPVFIFMAMGLSSFMISMNNIIFEFAPEGKRPTYMGLGGTTSAPFIILFSLIGGKLANHPELGYKLPFLVSMALNLLSCLILIFFVRDPRKKA